jgi:prepilin-type N-terminal cleavage/methylation domain-containing protein
MKIKLTKSGFTLPEAIVAAAVLGIAVTAIIQVFPSGIKTSSLSRRTTIAVNLAQAAIEETTSQSYADVASSPKQQISDDPASTFYQFYQQINVTYVDTNLNEVINDTGLKKIVATISWTEQGSEKQVQIPTLLSNK